MDFVFGVVRRLLLFIVTLESLFEKEPFDDVDDDDDPDELFVEPFNDFRLGLSTPMLEQVLANNANGLLFASNCEINQMKKKKKKEISQAIFKYA